MNAVTRLDRSGFLSESHSWSRRLGAGAPAHDRSRRAGSALFTKRTIRKGDHVRHRGVKGSVHGEISAVKEAGFEGVEPNSHMHQDEVLEAREANGLQTPSVCCSTHWDSPLSDPDPAVRARRA